MLGRNQFKFLTRNAQSENSEPEIRHGDCEETQVKQINETRQNWKHDLESESQN